MMPSEAGRPLQGGKASCDTGDKSCLPLHSLWQLREERSECWVQAVAGTSRWLAQLLKRPGSARSGHCQQDWPTLADPPTGYPTSDSQQLLCGA